MAEVELEMTMDDVRNGWPGACACDCNPVTSDRQGRIESTIMQAMSYVPTVQWLAWSLVPVPNPETGDRQGRIESPSCRPCLLCLL